MAEGGPNALETLMEFLYLAPVGLMKFGADGAIELLNPLAAELLLPHAATPNLSDAYVALAPLGQGLVQRLKTFDAPAGVVIDRERFDIARGAEQAALRLTVHRHPGGVNLAVLEDVSDQARQEAALKASDELLRLSLGVGGIVSFRRDIKAGTIRAASDAQSMFGVGDHDPPVPESNWGAMLLPEDLERVRHATEAAYAARARELRVGYRYADPLDGRIRHIESRSLIAYDETGAPESSLGVAIDVTQQREMDEKLVHLAHHDGLTDLANRALFRIRLEEAFARRRRGEAFALHCLDLDHFKAVNDSLGHTAGDELLRQVAARLRAQVRETDTVARLGGDEFAIIQCGVQAAGESVRLADRLIASIQAPFDLDGHVARIGTSVGIAMPSDGADNSEDLYRRADIALYRAKSEGRGAARVFESDMDVRVKARQALKLDLRAALDGEQFQVHYQPIIRARGRKIVSFEALLRWRHPRRGLVPPLHFIPLAEKEGLIHPIGRWVLEQACKEAVGWPSDIKVAVNLSPKQLGHPLLVTQTAGALSSSGLDPARLELEITETAILDDGEAMTEVLHRIRALGVRISLDDFGTGYSSLRRLQSFPFNTLKIDQSFVRWLGKDSISDAIVTAVINLAGALGIATVAEGVETMAQYGVLENGGCDQMQGLLIGPPLPSADIPSFLQAHEAERRRTLGPRVNALSGT
jgi:diguanylate cyclase (GGDEF)-like protein